MLIEFENRRKLFIPAAAAAAAATQRRRPPPHPPTYFPPWTTRPLMWPYCQVCLDQPRVGLGPLNRLHFFETWSNVKLRQLAAALQAAQHASTEGDAAEGAICCEPLPLLYFT